MLQRHFEVKLEFDKQTYVNILKAVHFIPIEMSQTV